MTEHIHPANEGNSAAGGPAYEPYNDSDEISLQDIFRAIWPYRWIITVLTLLIIVMTCTVAGIQYFMQPVTHVVEQEFKLTFQGINNNEYPNGTRFSAQDILSNPILNEVYEQNNLSEYFDDFSEFKSSLAVYQRNDRIKFLEKEYNARLSDTDLDTTERERLEQEFRTKKRNAMAPIFILTYERQVTGIINLPEELIGKVLKDILRSWADFAERVRGVTRYDMALISKNVLNKEDIEDENLLVANDMLRINAQRVISQLRKLQQLPGAHTIQTGEEAVTIEDLILRLEDAQRFQLEPLTGLIRQTGITKNKRSAMVYLENRLFNLGLEKEELAEKAKLFHNALDRYKSAGSSVSLPSSSEEGGAVGAPLFSQRGGGDVTTIPQFGSSFLNSIMELTRKSADTEFRQKIITQATNTGEKKVETTYEAKYYEQLMERIGETASSEKSTEEAEVEKAYALEQVTKVHKKVFDQLMSSIEQMHSIYQKLSRHNLSPESRMYAIEEPLLVKKVDTLSLKKTAMFSVLTIILLEFVMFIGIFIVHGFRRSLRPKNSL
ncbi:MAG: hypothetical protein K9J79_03960 [Desulfobacteraceae bacterium]|nr:hypothetical protein [Desulfobacteraceae bacterium]